MKKSEKFLSALSAVMNAERKREKIGTLGEKTLHAVLKYYFEPDSTKHEIKIGSFYADIANSEGITEIQTRNFYAIRRKLDFFLVSYKVKVVLPIIQTKNVCWINPADGTLISKRKSPKKGNIYQSMKELCAITDCIGDENLTVCLLITDIEEYRLLDGTGEDHKTKATKFEKIPVAIHDEIYLCDKKDYMLLLPPELGDCFSFDDFVKAVKLDRISAHRALKMLCRLEIIRLSGKNGRRYIYEVCDR